MKKLLITLILAVILVHGARPQAAIDVAGLINLYNQKQYEQVFNQAYEIRKKKQYAKVAALDYFMAKSLCAMADFYNAKRMYDYILTGYPLQKSQQQFFLAEKDACTKAEMQNELNRKFAEISYNVMNPRNIPSSKVAGKEGYVIDCTPDTNAYKINPAFNPAELSRRLFPVDKTSEAIDYYNLFFARKYSVANSGRYIFIGRKNTAATDQSAINLRDKLNKAYNFFWKYYGISAPDQLLCVYLMPDKASLQSVAKQAHGLILSENNIGYSSLGDLSILGIASENHLGTMYHELFHLMVRTDVGDIPGWLDEGFASLYETSYWENDSVLKGEIFNWRSNILKNYPRRLKDYTPDLARLVNDNWNAFQYSVQVDPCDISYNYAVVKHLAIYFQEHGLLDTVLLTFKNRKNVCTDTASVNETGIELLEKATGMRIDSLQKLFDRWLYDIYHIENRNTPGFTYRALGQIDEFKERISNITLGLNTLKGQQSLTGTDMSLCRKLMLEGLSFQVQLSDLIRENPEWKPGRKPSGKEITIPEPLRSTVDSYMSGARKFLYKYHVYGEY